MEKHCCSICCCHDNKDHSCKCSCSHKCCDTCHRCCRCRKDLCSDNFRVRLAGLQDGLSSRLQQMICCLVEMDLESGIKIKGTIIFVGSNFVEMVVNSTHLIDCENGEEVQNDFDEVSNEREHQKGQTWIFSIDKISHVILISPCHKENPCA